MPRSLLFLCLLAHVGLAQTSPLDSLKRRLTYLSRQPAGYVTDTLRCHTLKAITRAYVDTNIDSAGHYNQLLIEHCQKPMLEKHLFFAYLQAGYLHRVRGDYHQSIQWSYKALTLSEKHHDYTRMASAYSRLAMTYNDLERYKEALIMCKRGLDVLRQYPDTLIQLSILNSYGAIYRKQHRPAEALKVNQTMYNLARRSRSTWFQAQALHTVGWDYMELGDLDKPLSYYERAIELARQVGSADLEQSIWLHMAELYRRRGNLQQALTYCQQVKQAAIRMKNSSLVAEAYEKLYQIYKQANQPAEALAAHEAFEILRDSLSKEQANQRIESLQAQYVAAQQKIELQTKEDLNQRLTLTRNGLLIGAGLVLLVALLLFGNMRRLEAKNRKIDQQRTLLEAAQRQLAEANTTLETRVQERTEALVQANLELTQKNADIKAALFRGQTIERKRVALELHDNLSSLLSAVNMSMQAIDPQHLTESEQSIYRSLRHMVQNAYAEVRNISHNILPAGLEKDGLVPTLTALIDRLNHSTSLRFTLTVTGLTQRLPVEIEFNTYSIVLELLNNALKHAQATAVSIGLSHTETTLRLTVADDGIGLGPQEAKRGVGLQNIQARLDGLGGVFNVSAVEKGTCIQLEIPIEAVSVDGEIV
jgi:two-component system, NarL family, sensor histidine kinase LiaS